MKRKRKYLLIVLLCVLGPPFVIYAFRCVMHQVGYSGSGTVRNKCGLPYGVGMFFDGMRIDGPVHFAYKTGPRGVDCLFVGNSDAASVRTWAAKAGVREARFSGAGALPKGRGLADDLPVNLHEYMGPRSEGDVTAMEDEPSPIVRGAMIHVVYRDATGRVVVEIHSPWSDLRRHRFWGESWE
jgi:hypothetical protein